MDLELVIGLVVLIGLLSKGFGQDVDNMYRCPDHLSRTDYLKAFKDKCYRFETSEMYWTSARDRCSRENGTLIQIRNQETQNWVVNTLNALPWSTNDVWIGANDRNNEMEWRWVTGEKIDWSYWAPGQANCKHLCMENCGTLRRYDGGRWHDKPCSLLLYKYSFICQFDMNNATTMTTPTMELGTNNITVVDAVIPEGALAGLVVACVFGALVLLILINVFVCKRRKKEDRENIIYNVSTLNQNIGHGCHINNLPTIQ